MFRILALFLIILFSCSGLFNICMAQQGFVRTGTISIKETKNNGKKVNEAVKFTLSNNFARIDTPYKLYYLVNLPEEKAFIINTKRKTVTVTAPSEVVDDPLPPLAILKDRTSLKKYLCEVNAQLVTTFQEDKIKFEIWRFNIGKIFYKVTIQLPEYYPVKVEFSSNKRNTVATVLEQKLISASELSDDYFSFPKGYNVVNLITK